MVRISIRVEGLTQGEDFLKSVVTNMPKTRNKTLAQGAKFFRLTAFKEAHWITKKTRESIQHFIASSTTNSAEITAGFGAFYEQQRDGEKYGRSHKFMTTAETKLYPVMETYINTNYVKLLNTGKA